MWRPIRTSLIRVAGEQVDDDADCITPRADTSAARIYRLSAFQPFPPSTDIQPIEPNPIALLRLADEEVEDMHMARSRAQILIDAAYDAYDRIHLRSLK
jgi:hypothetical protein